MPPRSAPNKDTPYIDDGSLYVPDVTGAIEQVIRVDSPAWLHWLGDATRFYVKHPAGNFFCRKESRARGDRYWIAYRRHGKLFNRYLGRDQDVTCATLNTTAHDLATRIHAPTETPV